MKQTRKEEERRRPEFRPPVPFMPVLSRIKSSKYPSGPWSSFFANMRLVISIKKLLSSAYTPPLVRLKPMFLPFLI